MGTDHIRARLAVSQRLCILRMILEAPSGMLNESVIDVGLQDYLLPASRDEIREMLTWLETEGLVILGTLPNGGRGVGLTDRGSKVGQGLLQHPGVQRPNLSEVARKMFQTAVDLYFKE